MPFDVPGLADMRVLTSAKRAVPGIQGADGRNGMGMSLTGINEYRGEACAYLLLPGVPIIFIGP